MHRRWLASAFLLLVACRTPKTTASGGPPEPGAIPSTRCDGRAPLDPDVAGVPGARASWFNDPSGHERLYVLEAGPPTRATHEPTLVLIHGVGSIGIRDYYPALAHLSRARHVIAIDLPGFGRSDPQDDDYGAERLARSIDTVVRACTTGHIDVVGHSSGGTLAVLFAAERADVVRRLVLVDVAGILRPEVLLQGQLHQTLTPMREHVPRLAKAVESTGSVMIDAIQVLVPSAEKVADTGLLGNSPGVLAASALLDFNFGPAIAAITAPTLILWAQDDHVVPTRIARLLAARIERSEIEFIKDSGHVPMKDQPAAMAALVNEFLSGPSPARPKPRAPLAATLPDGACNEQDDATLTGDFNHVVIVRCKNFRLKDARARQVTIRKSAGHLEDAEISDGLTTDEADLTITGGSLRGAVALDASDSELDIAGTILAGTEAALRVRTKSHIVLSVSKVESPKTHAFLHQDLKAAAGDEW